MTVVAPADLPKWVRNSCLIERICSVFVSFHLCIVRRLGCLYHGCVRSLPFSLYVCKPVQWNHSSDSFFFCLPGCLNDIRVLIRFFLCTGDLIGFFLATWLLHETRVLIRFFLSSLLSKLKMRPEFWFVSFCRPCCLN